MSTEHEITYDKEMYCLVANLKADLRGLNSEK